jgi:hypothetical protein
MNSKLKLFLVQKFFIVPLFFAFLSSSPTHAMFTSASLGCWGVSLGTSIVCFIGGIGTGCLGSSFANCTTNAVGYRSRVWTYSNYLLNKGQLRFCHCFDGKIELVDEINRANEESILRVLPENDKDRIKEILNNKGNSIEAELFLKGQYEKIDRLAALISLFGIEETDLSNEYSEEGILADTTVLYFIENNCQAFFGKDDTPWINEYIKPGLERIIVELAHYNLSSLTPTEKEKLLDKFYLEINALLKADANRPQGFVGSPKYDQMVLQIWLLKRFEYSLKKLEEHEKNS